MLDCRQPTRESRRRKAQTGHRSHHRPTRAERRAAAVLGSLLELEPEPETEPEQELEPETELEPEPEPEPELREKEDANNNIYSGKSKTK